MEVNAALSPEKRRQILAGAATVFAADGYEGASMSRIAAVAGVYVLLTVLGWFGLG